MIAVPAVLTSIASRFSLRGAIAAGIILAIAGTHLTTKWSERRKCERRFAVAAERAIKEARERDLRALERSQQVIDETREALAKTREAGKESEAAYEQKLKALQNPSSPCNWDDDGFNRL